MKKQITFLAFFIIFTMTSFAQPANTGVELYRCQSAYVSLNVENRWIDSTYNNVSYLISFDIDKAFVSVSNGKQTEIYLDSQTTEAIKGIDKNGNKYTKVVWLCRDENGIKCELTSIDYTNLPDRVFQLRYNDCVCIWYTVIIKRGKYIPQTVQTNNNI
jgi:hypothetical protein